MVREIQKPGHLPADEQARITSIREAMREGAPMSINGVPGQWDQRGEVWTADVRPPGAALLLVRISDAEPGDIFGVARQVQDTIKQAGRVGWPVGMILVENDTSAFKRRKIKLPNGETQLRTVRPKFRRALGLLSKGTFRRFMTYHLDRTVRDPRDLEDLIDVVEGSRPRIVVGSYTGSLRLANDTDITSARIHCAIANQASRDTSRRVSRKRREQAEEGRYGGGRRPYGFESDGVTLRRDEAQHIAHYTAVALTDVSMKEIARDMKLAGVVTTSGKPFSAAAARDMLLRPRNAGLTVHRSERDHVSHMDDDYDQDDENAEEPETGKPLHYTPDDVVGTLPGEPIVDPEDYWALVRKLTDPNRRTNYAGTAPVLLGAGIYNCPCGDKMRTQPKRRKIKDRQTGEVIRIEVIRNYRCSSPERPGNVASGPGHVTVTADDLDRLVEATIHELIELSEPADIIGYEPGKKMADVPALRVEIAKHEKRLIEISEEYEADEITKAQMKSMTATRRKKLDDAKAALDRALENTNPVVKLIGVENIAEAWEDLSLGEQREICRRMLRVTVLPIGRGRRNVPVRERVRIEKIWPTTGQTSKSGS
ncbi:recombinase family protein [Nonomuraea sp. NPDC023979]|uniref:recombinase family protein n=1 Tax=Nonomuraea sp. NPDC023979 TaxID=3154796 RepID=UPI00341170FB